MKFKLAMFLFLFSSSCFSDDIRIGFGAGRGDIGYDDSDVTDGSLSRYLYLGYRLDNNIVVDLAYGEMRDVFFGLIDNVQFDTYEVLLGYRFNFNKFYLEPKLGYAKWDFELDSGLFSDSDFEQKIEKTSNDPLVSLVAGYKFVPLFGMSVSYKYFDFDYGHAKSVYLGFDFEF